MSIIIRLFQIIVLPLFIMVIVVSNTSCSKNEIDDILTNTYAGPKIQYSTYHLEATDIRLKCLHHPLYRLEYPSIFELIDENLADIPHISCDETRVEFTVQQTHIPKSWLSIVVEKPGYRDYHDAAESLEFTLDFIRDSTNNFSKMEMEIFGIPAYYLESHINDVWDPEDSEYQILSRTVFFDYSELIWEITLCWYYRGTIGPEVEEYFKHVIETFEILE